MKRNFVFAMCVSFGALLLLSALPVSCSCDSNEDACPKGQELVDGNCLPIVDGDEDINTDVDPDPNQDRDRNTDEPTETEESEELAPQCQNDSDCDPGLYCGALQQCRQDCTSDGECSDGSYCNGSGQCAVLRAADTDAETQACANSDHSDCPTGYICGAENVCIEGCASRTDCRFGNDCIDSMCQPVTADGDAAQCTSNDDCDPGQICLGNICVTEQPDIEVPERQDGESDSEEIPRTPCDSQDDCQIGSYCGDDNFCATDCFVKEDCPQGRICIVEEGRCVIPGGDEDGLDEVGCTQDSDCGQGTYCKNNVCDYDCNQDSQCNQAAGEVCGDRGKCVVPGDEDIDDVADAIICTADEDCPPTLYCTGANICGMECTGNEQCPDGYTCNERSKCVPPGDEETLCMEDTDCPSGTYCNAERACARDCVNNEDCTNGTDVCSPQGRCVPPQADEDQTESDIINCQDDVACPADMHCLGTGICGRLCGEEIGQCEPGQICDERGRCVADGDAEQDEEYDVPPGYCGPLPPLERGCANDSECGVIFSSNFCECQAIGPAETRPNFQRYVMEGDQCVIDTQVCEDAGCQGLQPKCIDNVCELLPPGDEDLAEGTCNADVDCPGGFYCDMENHLCVQDCISDQDCAENEYCNDIGKCLTID